MKDEWKVIFFTIRLDASATLNVRHDLQFSLFLGWAKPHLHTTHSFRCCRHCFYSMEISCFDSIDPVNVDF